MIVYNVGTGYLCHYKIYNFRIYYIIGYYVVIYTYSPIHFRLDYFYYFSKFRNPNTHMKNVTSADGIKRINNIHIKYTPL